MVAESKLFSRNPETSHLQQSGRLHCVDAVPPPTHDLLVVSIQFQGLGFRIRGLGFRVKPLAFRFLSLYIIPTLAPTKFYK